MHFVQAHMCPADFQELIGDEFQIDTMDLGSISCDSVITALLYWQGKLFVGRADRVTNVRQTFYHMGLAIETYRSTRNWFPYMQVSLMLSRRL